MSRKSLNAQPRNQSPRERQERAREEKRAMARNIEIDNRVRAAARALGMTPLAPLARREVPVLNPALGRQRRRRG